MEQQNNTQPPVQAEKKDLSRETLTVLTILVVMISVLGTLTVMNEAAKIQPAPMTISESNSDLSSSDARVSLNIVPRQPHIPTETTTAHVVLEINNPAYPG